MKWAARIAERRDMKLFKWYWRKRSGRRIRLARVRALILAMVVCVACFGCVGPKNWLEDKIDSRAQRRLTLIMSA
jgi:hypothetical protein